MREGLILASVSDELLVLVCLPFYFIPEQLLVSVIVRSCSNLGACHDFDLRYNIDSHSLNLGPGQLGCQSWYRYWSCFKVVLCLVPRQSRISLVLFSVLVIKRIRICIKVGHMASVVTAILVTKYDTNINISKRVRERFRNLLEHV